MEIFMRDKNEIRFVPNPDYPEDWNERQREKLGDCFGVVNFAVESDFCAVPALRRKCPSSFLYVDARRRIIPLLLVDSFQILCYNLDINERK